MLNEKELSIIKALVEEEKYKAGSFDENNMGTLVGQYMGTLSGIVGKIDEFM